MRRVLEQRVARDVDLVEADVLAEVAEPERQAVRDDVDVVPAPCELLAELGRHRPRAAHGRVADDADPQSRITWWPFANTSILPSEDVGEPKAVAGEGRDEPEPALLQRAAGEERVARAAQPLGPALVALLERAERLLVETVDLVQRAPARRRGGGAQRRVVAPERLLEGARLAHDRLARAGEGGLDVGIRLARPARDERPPGRPRGRGASAPRCRARAPASARRSSRSAAAGSPVAGCRSARTTGRSGRGTPPRPARRRTPPSGGGRPAPAGAAARPGSTARGRPRAGAAPRRPRAARACRGPRSCRSRTRAPGAGPRRRGTRSGTPAAPAPAGGSRRRAAPVPRSIARRDVGEPSRISRARRGAASAFSSGSEGSRTTRPGRSRETKRANAPDTVSPGT